MLLVFVMAAAVAIMLYRELRASPSKRSVTRKRC